MEFKSTLLKQQPGQKKKKKDAKFCYFQSVYEELVI